jgi:protein TonB
MGALPIPEPTGLRYAPYIEELRGFVVSSGLPCGSPDNIFAVVERLQASTPFAEDLASLVRSMVLCEGGSMPHAQLLEILALAIGGPDMEHISEPYRQPLRKLLAFITSVLGRPWNQPPAERAEVVPFPTDTAAAVAATMAPPTPHREPPPPPRLEVRFEPPPAPEPVPSNFQPQTAPSNFQPQTAFQSQTAPSPEAASWLTAEQPKPTPWLSPSMREVLLAAVFCILVAGMVAFALRPGSPLPSEITPPTPAPQAAPASSSAQQPAPASKPTAYGEAFLPNPVHRGPSPQVVPGSGAAAARLYLDVAPGVMTGNLVSAPLPSYPLIARIAHVRGPVEVRAVIARDGTVADARALRGHHLLRGAAVKAVRTWRFRPYQLDGQPVEVFTVLTINFPKRS